MALTAARSREATRGRPGRFLSRSPGQTRALGRQLGRLLQGDEVIALVGPLGAGKTCLVQGLGRGLEVRRPINSPSFVLLKRYQGRRILEHWDWYRLGGDEDLDSTGYGDVPDDRAVVVIEWADRFLDRIAKPFLLVEFERINTRVRRIVLSVRGQSKILEQIVNDLGTWWTERNR